MTDEMINRSMTLKDIRQILEEIHTEIACLKEILSTEEAAKLLHTSNARIDELRRAGSLTGIKIGKGYVFRRTDICDYIIERQIEGVEQ